jgi:MFS family permease
LILGMWGLGSVVGSAFAGRMTERAEPATLVTGFLVAAVGGIGIWLSPWFALILACNVAWGVGDALASVAEQGILQRRTPDAVRARVFAANESLVHATLMVAFLVAGPVVEMVGAKTTYLLGGLGALAASLLAESVVRSVQRDELAS